MLSRRYVGESESFVRELFAEAELEQAERGDESALHVIVLDELDAFARERGSLKGDTSGIRDSVINQLLAKMDGVEALDNILVVGLTNRSGLYGAAWQSTTERAGAVHHRGRLVSHAIEGAVSDQVSVHPRGSSVIPHHREGIVSPPQSEQCQFQSRPIFLNWR